MFSLRVKVIAVPILVMFLVSVLSFIVLEKYLSSVLIEDTENELIHAASSVVETLHSFDSEPSITQLDQLSDRIAKVWDFRVTIINTEGVVLGDSILPVDAVRTIENHGERAEVRSALATGLGVARRHSETANQEFLYIAVLDDHSVIEHSTSVIKPSTPASSNNYVVRVSIPTDKIHQKIRKLDIIFWLVGLVSLSGTAILSFIGSRVLVNRINAEHEVLEQRVIDRTKDISLLQSLSSLLNTCITLEEASDITRKIIPSLLPNTHGAIAIHKASRNRLEILMHWGGEWPGHTSYNPDECWALRKGKRHYSEFEDIGISCAHMDGYHEHPTVCIPLLAQGDTLGVLHILSENSEKGTFDGPLATSIAEHLGLAIANLQLRNNLRQQAIRDPLTGLYNRRYLTEVLEQTINQAKRRNNMIAVCMVDLDHFKKINDSFGHDAGDLVLKKVADEFKSCSRVGDIACRYGGEEFCLVFIDISEKNALYVAEKIRNRVKELELNYKLKPLGRVTLSMGLSIYPIHGTSASELIQLSDKLLYQAKAEGRDKVVLGSVNIDAT